MSLMTARVFKLEQPSAEALVEGARAGDLKAKEALFRRYVTMVSGMAFRLLGDDHELEDIVQETFVAAFAGLHKLESAAAFSTWLGAIVTGRTISVIRKRRLLRRLGIGPRQAIDLERILAPNAPPDVAAELSAIYRAIEAMPTRERVVLVLRRVEQFSFDEIVQQTGWSLATVKRRLVRAEGYLVEPPARSRSRGER